MLTWKCHPYPWSQSVCFFAYHTTRPWGVRYREIGVLLCIWHPLRTRFSLNKALMWYRTEEVKQSAKVHWSLGPRVHMINHNPTSRNRLPGCLPRRKTSYQAIVRTSWVQEWNAKLFSQSLVASESCQPQQTLACLTDISSGLPAAIKHRKKLFWLAAF